VVPWIPYSAYGEVREPPYEGCPKKAAWESARCTLFGTALACPIVACLVSDWAHQSRLTSTVPCMKFVLDRTGPMLMHGVCSRDAQWKAVTELGMEEVQEFTTETFRRCSHRGTGLWWSTRPSGRPDAWPIGCVPAGLFVGDVDLAFKLNPAMIAVQELRAVLSAMKRLTRQSEQAGSRFLHLVDSQVSLVALAKGRSSSSALTCRWQQSSAVNLASNLSRWSVAMAKQSVASRRLTPAEKAVARRKLDHWLRRVYRQDCERSTAAQSKSFSPTCAEKANCCQCW
jgi:hypothetical protein